MGSLALCSSGVWDEAEASSLPLDEVRKLGDQIFGHAPADREVALEDPHGGLLWSLLSVEWISCGPLVWACSFFEGT